MAGVRTALKHYSITAKATGGTTKFYIPTTTNMNAVEKRTQADKKIAGVYPEFFISLNTKNGYTFDGGILFNGVKWLAFIYGGSEGKWYEEELSSNYHGSTVKVDFRGVNKLVDGEIRRYLVLFIDGTPILKLGKQIDSYANRKHDLGYEIEDASWAGINTATYEMNLVPTNNLKYMEYVDGEGERAYFLRAKCSSAGLYGESTLLLSSTYYKKQTYCNIDSNPYYPSSIIYEVTRIWSSGDNYFESTISFRDV